MFANTIIWHTLYYYSYDAKIINKSFKLYKLSVILSSIMIIEPPLLYFIVEFFT